MSNKPTVFSEEAALSLIKKVKRLEGKLPLPPLREDPTRNSEDRISRLGITSLGPASDPYPPSGNEFWVELGDGVTSVSFDAYASPKEYRQVKTLDGGWVALGSVVNLTLHHGKWRITDNPRHYLFTMIGGWTGQSPTALATMTDMFERGSVSDSIQDPLNMFSTLKSGATGICIRQHNEFWVVSALPCHEKLERFTMLSGWQGTTAWASFRLATAASIDQYGILEDPEGIFTDQIGSGSTGLSIRTCNGRHFVIQAACDQESTPPPSAPTGSCRIGSPGDGNCIVTTEAICNSIEGVTVWTEGASCPVIW